MFNQYWSVMIPGLILFAIAIIVTNINNIPDILSWICFIIGIPGAFLSYKGMMIWKKIMTTDKTCRRFLNKNQDKSVNFFTRDSKLKDIEFAVRRKLVF